MNRSSVIMKNVKNLPVFGNFGGRGGGLGGRNLSYDTPRVLKVLHAKFQLPGLSRSLVISAQTNKQTDFELYILRLRCICNVIYKS